MSTIKSKQISDFTSSVRSQITAGAGISITDGQISSTATSVSRPTYSVETSFPLNLTNVNYSGVIKRKYYINNGSSNVAVNLPSVSSCDGVELILKRLGSGTVTVNASDSEMIDGASTFSIPQQYASLTITATSSGWYIE